MSLAYSVLIYYLNIPVAVEVNVEIKFRYGRNVKNCIEMYSDVQTRNERCKIIYFGLLTYMVSIYGTAKDLFNRNDFGQVYRS